MDLGASGPSNSTTYYFRAASETGSLGPTRSSSLMSRVVARCDTGTLDLVMAYLRLRRVGSTDMERLRPLTCYYVGALRDRVAACRDNWTWNWWDSSTSQSSCLGRLRLGRVLTGVQCQLQGLHLRGECLNWTLCWPWCRPIILVTISFTRIKFKPLSNIRYMTLGFHRWDPVTVDRDVS
jgi:hypothetical protein